MAGCNEVLLVRHGETDDNAVARFQGRTDTVLNARGREQSHALGHALRGAGLCALYSSPLRRAHETARIVGAAIGLTSFGLAPSVPLAIGALLIVGASFLTFAAATVTLTQALAPARLRGRLVSLFATLYWGMMPVGALLVGLVAEATTGRTAIALCGAGLAIAGATAFFARPQIATLSVGRDGLTLSGDLRGSGAEPPSLSA